MTNFISSEQGFFADVTGEIATGVQSTKIVNFVDWKGNGDEKAIAVTSGKEPGEVVKCLRESNIRHIVQKDSPQWCTDLQTGAQFIQNNEIYFSQPAVSLLKVSEFEKMPVMTFEFRPSTPKRELFSKIIESVESVRSEGLVESLNVIMEELYMNAILDAPRAAIGRGRESAPYPPKKGAAKFHVCFDDHRLAIACEDPYGELNPQSFIKRMDEVYTQGARQAMRMDSALGAGLGCMLIFEKCESLYLGVQPQKKTLVSCLLTLNASAKKRAGFRKNLHLIY